MALLNKSSNQKKDKTLRTREVLVTPLLSLIGFEGTNWEKSMICASSNGFIFECAFGAIRFGPTHHKSNFECRSDAQRMLSECWRRVRARDRAAYQKVATKHRCWIGSSLENGTRSVHKFGPR